MKKTAIGCGIAVAVILVILVIGLILASIGGGSYNRLVRLSQDTNAKWAQVQNDYQRRADLIPNLVSTVEGAANFEKSTLTQIAEARASINNVHLDPNSAPTDPSKLAEFDRAQKQLSSALSRLLVVVERYPDLKANANFVALQAQLEGTENRIAVARRDFNESVQSYDTAIKSFPANFYAASLGFKEKPYFAAEAGAEKAPKVQFNFGNPNAPAQTPAPAK